MVEDALRESLAREPDRVQPFALPTFDGGGVFPGVDLSDNSALRDIMDGL